MRWGAGDPRLVGQDAEVGRLILVNGPPASGESTVARRYVDELYEGVPTWVDPVWTERPCTAADRPAPSGADGTRTHDLLVANQTL